MNYADAETNVPATPKSQTPKTPKSKRGQKGFSLIELLIVVAIVLIIAAIAIPNLLKAKQTADASGAVGTMRTINSALQIYAATYGDYPTTPALASTELACPASGAASSTNACLLDAATAAALGGTGTRNHYSWTYTYTAGTGGAASAFTVLAAPGTGLTQSVRQFLLDQSGIIRFADGAAPTSTSSPM